MSKQPYLNVAIVQSTIDGTIAWNSNATYAPEMSPSESKRAWNEIMVAISQYNNLVETARPEVIILPELTLAHQYERKIADLAKQVGAIIIGGCDFKFSTTLLAAWNRKRTIAQHTFREETPCKI